MLEALQWRAQQLLPVTTGIGIESYCRLAESNVVFLLRLKMLRCPRPQLNYLDAVLTPEDSV